MRFNMTMRIVGLVLIVTLFLLLAFSQPLGKDVSIAELEGGKANKWLCFIVAVATADACLTPGMEFACVMGIICLSENC